MVLRKNKKNTFAQIQIKDFLPYNKIKNPAGIKKIWIKNEINLLRFNDLKYSSISVKMT